MTAGLIVALAVVVVLIAFVLLLLIQTGAGRGHHPAPPTGPLVGRQQIRSAARAEAWRQIGGAPVDRKTRRQASRELANAATKQPTIKES